MRRTNIIDEWEKVSPKRPSILTDTQVMRVLLNKERIAKNVITMFEAEAQKRNLTEDSITTGADPAEIERQNAPLPWKYKLLIALLDPLLITAAKWPYLILRLGLGAYFEGKGYKRWTRDSWNYLCIGFILYLAVVVIVSQAYTNSA